MFGSTKRRERREQEALRAATIAQSMRPSLDVAVHEALESSSPVTLRVHNLEVRGYGNGSCMFNCITWNGLDYFFHQVQYWREELGKRYKVCGFLSASVPQMPLSLAMDLASGQRNPRMHAMRHKQVVIEISEKADVEQNRTKVRRAHVYRHWIQISKR